MTNSGTIGCSGTCSASTPSDAFCPPPPPPNFSPSASSLNRQLTTQEITPCTSNVHFTWSFSDPEDGSNQSGYQLQVDDSSSFSSVNYDTGSVSTSSKERYVSIGSTLSFNTTYYWRLRVRDSGGQWSSYVNGSNFATPPHAAPTPNFTWTPSSPSSGESVQFVDQSSAASGASISSYSWSFVSGTPSSSSDEDPTTVFSAGGTQSATLEVTDSSAISCSITKSVSVSLPLPDIEEIPPTASTQAPFGFLGGILERVAAIARAVQGE